MLDGRNAPPCPTYVVLGIKHRASSYVLDKHSSSRFPAPALTVAAFATYAALSSPILLPKDIRFSSHFAFMLRVVENGFLGNPIIGL